MKYIVRDASRVLRDDLTSFGDLLNLRSHLQWHCRIAPFTLRYMAHYIALPGG